MDRPLPPPLPSAALCCPGYLLDGGHRCCCKFRRLPDLNANYARWAAPLAGCGCHEADLCASEGAGLEGEPRPCGRRLPCEGKTRSGPGLAVGECVCVSVSVCVCVCPCECVCVCHCECVYLCECVCPCECVCSLSLLCLTLLVRTPVLVQSESG